MGTIAKIAEVMKTVGFLKKDKTIGGGGNYMYLSEEKISGELHNAFADIGLVIYPEDMEIIENREDTTRAGNSLHNCRIRVKWSVSDGEDAIHLITLGEGSDSGDKTLNKCMTGAYKYALRQLLLISTGDDPDHTPSQESTHSEPKPEPGITTGSFKQAAPAPKPTPASAAGATPRGNLDWRLELFGRLGWTEQKEDGSTGPSKDAFYFLRKQDVPKSWREWTTADCDKVRVALLEEISLHQPAPTLPDISDLEDPFREQG